jgi:hypothetical protein
VDGVQRAQLPRLELTGSIEDRLVDADEVGY